MSKKNDTLMLLAKNYKAPLLLLAGGILFLALNMLRKLGRIVIDEPFEYFSVILENAPLLFTLMAILSLYIVSDFVQMGVAETLLSVKNGYAKMIVYWTKWLLAGAAAAGILLGLLGSGFIALQPMSAILFSRGESIGYVAASIVVHLILPAATGVLLGVTLSFLRNRLLGYLLIVFSLLVSYVLVESQIIPGMLYEMFGINFFGFMQIFMIFPENLHFRPLEAFGFPIQIHQIARLLFWISLFLFLIHYNLRNLQTEKKRTCQMATALIVLGLSSAFYLWPASHVSVDGNPFFGEGADRYYYNEQKQKTEAVNWSIESYEMDLTVFRKLNARVAVQITQPVEGDIPFTLHHGYKVSKVRDAENRDLDFLQEGDYITVQATQPTESLEFVYSGSCNAYYSNEQGINLPGSFPWYPHAGFFRTFNTENRGYLPTPFPEPKEIRLSIRYPRKIFTNLSEEEKGIWSGRTTGVTIVAGFYGEEEIDGIRYVYPYLNRYNFQNEFLRDLGEKIKVDDRVPDGARTVIGITDINLHSAVERLFVLSDHIVTGDPLNYDHYIHEIGLMPNKINISQIMETYLQNREAFDALVQATIDYANSDTIVPKEEIFATDYMYRIGMVLQCDEEKGLELYRQFMEDDSDYRTTVEFIEDLERAIP